MITEADVEKLFAAHLEKISDEGLRKQVVEIWVEGCKRGKWESVEELEDMPFTLLTDHQGINFIEHTLSVTDGALALAIAQKENYSSLPYDINLDRVIAGGILHDIGKLMEIEKDGSGGYRKSHAGKCARHPISGAILAAELGADQETINIIICHAKEGENRPQVIESVFVHQADFATFNPLVMLKAGTLIQ